MSQETNDLSIETLQIIEDMPLFYPCSGSDYLCPINMFAPYVKDFWFADIAYFRGNNPVENAKSVLRQCDSFKFLDKSIEKQLIPDEEWKTDRMYRGGPPCIRTETYLHKESNQIIRVHLHRRRGPTAMRERIDKLGVFFYRGCSDEGSSTYWLTPRINSGKDWRRGQIDEVLDKLIDGGLIVTDGSMCMGENNPYREFRRFSSDRNIGPKAVEMAKSFEDNEGRCFNCIGYAGEKYGPTLVWQVFNHSKKQVMI